MAFIGNQPAESFTSFATQEFSTSATTSYTLDHAVTNENEIALFINNVRQQPGSGKAYTATGTALTLSAATASTDTMYCVFLGRALQTVTPATNSITAAMVGNDLISGKDALASEPADTDEFLVSDAGTLKRIDYSLIKSSPGLDLILTQTLSGNVSSVDFIHGTNGCIIDSTYEYYIVKFSGVRFDAQGGLQARIGTSGGFISASDYHMNEANLLANGSDWVLNQSQTKNSIRISDRRYTNTTAGFSISGEITFYNMSSTSLYKSYHSIAVGWGNNTSEGSYIIGAGSLEDSTSKDAVNDRIQFLPLSASNIASGSFTLYGVKK